jgi:hypothetical protein
MPEYISVHVDLNDVVLDLNPKEAQKLLSAYEKNKVSWDVSGPILVRVLDALSDYKDDKSCPYEEVLKVKEWAEKEFKDSKFS